MFFQRPADARFDVVGLGNAVVDVIAPAPTEVVVDAGLALGAMTLVDADRSDQLYARMGQGVEMSGGSCANSMAAIAAMGGAAAFIGRVRDDQFGRIFVHDCRAAGVTFANEPVTEGAPTARCLVFVHPDSQRSMATYLGACVELGPKDLQPALIADAAVTFLEGYLYDRAPAKAACLEAAKLAHARGRKVALSLSDPFCVDRWRAEFRELIDAHVDLLFANEAEITSLFEVESFDEALQAVRGTVEIAALTRGPKGSVLLAGDEVHVIDAAKVERVVDTTGAGDLYAAGLIRGLTEGLDLAASGRLAALAAGQIIQQYGTRAETPLAPLVSEAERSRGALRA
ncbi:MAG: adenosine kinase [Geminicoccaceae bacterium]|nr:MAG: adenosine kinase [Geminicoccaceae bacterium]